MTTPQKYRDEFDVIRTAKKSHLVLYGFAACISIGGLAIGISQSMHTMDVQNATYERTLSWVTPAGNVIDHAGINHGGIADNPAYGNVTPPTC
jgi:hypothetical protein